MHTQALSWSGIANFPFLAARLLMPQVDVIIKIEAEKWVSTTSDYLCNLLKPILCANPYG